jgi:acyl dehydratase
MLEPGTPIEFYAFPPITREQLREYANASGDFNPIHLDEEAAKNAGLPGIIAHGMLIAAFISERALEFVQSERSLAEFEMKYFHTRFKAMVQVGDIPSVGGILKKVSPTECTLELQAKNQRGEVTTIGTAAFILRHPPCANLDHSSD